MSAADLGQVIVPTGGGKTFIMIQDALRALSSGPKTIVVVAPRILLANQLCDEFMQQISATWTHVAHCHSGETHYFSSTKSDKIECFVKTARAAGESAIVFTTYHSLGRVVDAGVESESLVRVVEPIIHEKTPCGKHRVSVLTVTGSGVGSDPQPFVLVFRD